MTINTNTTGSTVTAAINTISYTGLATIKFSEDVYVPYDYTKLNSSYL
jgi:hypothetical protein